MEGGDRNNGEIGTSAPFGLVKEAVALFEERVHAGDHVNRVQQVSKARDEVDHVTTQLEKMTLELKETKQNLQKAVDEGMVMANCLSILQKELEQTKRELQQLKQKDQYSSRYQSMTGPADEVWVEKTDGKQVEEDVTKFEAKPELIVNHEKELEFQKKNYDTFANGPSLTKFIVPDGEPAPERHPSHKTKKKKPLIGGIFSRKKGSMEKLSLEEFDYKELIWS